MTIRKSITLQENEYNTIKQYAKKVGLSFSEFLRKSSLSVIQQEEELGLKEFIHKHADFVSSEEQKQIDKLGIDYTNTKGKEVNINDFI